MSKSRIHEHLQKERMGATSSAYDRGRQDFWKHGDKGNCPFTDEARADAWMKGFDAARSEEEQR